MLISPFGICLVVLAISLVISKRSIVDSYFSVWQLAFVVEGCVTAGTFLSTRSFSLSWGDYFQIVLLFLAVIMSLCERKPISIYFRVFFIIVIGNLLILAFFPLKELVRDYAALDRSLTYYSVSDIYVYPKMGIQPIKTAVRFLVYIANALSLFYFISIERWTVIVNKYISIWKFVLKYLTFEFIIKNIFHRYRYIQILDWFFGSKGAMTRVSTIRRNGLFTLIGFNAEPSHLLMVAIPFLIVYVLSDVDDYSVKKKYMIILYTFFVCFLSGSFRAVGMLPIVLVFMLIKFKGNPFLYGGIIVFLISAFLIGVTGNFDYLSDRLASVWIDYNSGSYFSEGRLNTIFEAFSVFLKRPLVGCGLGTAFAYGFIPSILETFGLIGALYWYRIMFFKIARVKYIRHGVIYMLLLTVMWIYTNAISTGYIETTLMLCLAISFSQMQNKVENSFSNVLF